MAADHDPTQSTQTVAGATEEHCAQCGKLLSANDRVAAGDRLFCQSCHETLRLQLETAVQAMSEDINYPGALAGAVLGGAAGVLAWWGFTAATKWSVGLIAVGLGYAVGWGTVRFAGDKRSQGLQILSAAVACVSWVVATYLVNMTFLNRAFAEQGKDMRVLFPPQTLDLAWSVLTAGFGIMDVVFLAIMVHTAWKFPRPIRLAPPAGG